MSSNPKSHVVIGGKLNLKGDKKKSKKRKTADAQDQGENSASITSQVASTEGSSSNIEHIPREEFLTSTQKKHREKLLEAEAREMKKQASMSYRDKVDAFNSKLSTLTEHNDIPRVSAAGNG